MLTSSHSVVCAMGSGPAHPSELGDVHSESAHRLGHFPRDRGDEEDIVSCSLVSETVKTKVKLIIFGPIQYAHHIRD